MSDNMVKDKAEADATGEKTLPEAEVVVGGPLTPRPYFRDGILDDLADVSNKLARGVPVSTGTAVRSIGGTVLALGLAYWVVGKLGLSGVVGAFAGVGLLIGIDVGIARYHASTETETPP